MALETKRFNSEVLEHVRVRPGQRILEIGFGHGYTLQRVAMNESFDGAFAVHTIYFWQDLSTHLSEIHRVLVPGARVVGFREKNGVTEKALPAEVYNLGSAQHVADLLRYPGHFAGSGVGRG